MTRRTTEAGLSSLTMTDPAVFAGDTGAFRCALVDSSSFDFSVFFEVALEAGAEELGAVSFKEGATFDFAVARLVRRDGAALFVTVFFFACFAFSSLFPRLTELVDFLGLGAGSDFGFAFDILLRLPSAVDLPLLLFSFSAAVDLVVPLCFASLTSVCFFSRRAGLVVVFFGAAFSLVDRAFLAVLLDAVDFFEDADGLALEVEAALEVDAAFSEDLLFVFVEGVFGGLSFAEAVESRALAAALGLLLSLNGLLFLAFVSTDFFAAEAFTFSDVYYGRPPSATW